MLLLSENQIIQEFVLQKSQATMTYWDFMGTCCLVSKRWQTECYIDTTWGQCDFPSKWNVTLGEGCFNVAKPYQWIVILAPPGCDIVDR